MNGLFILVGFATPRTFKKMNVFNEISTCLVKEVKVPKYSYVLFIYSEGPCCC